MQKACSTGPRHGSRKMDLSKIQETDPHSPITSKMDSPNIQNRSREQRMTQKVRIHKASTKYNQRTLNKVRISVSSPKYNQRTLNKVGISVSSPKYNQRTLSKVRISVSSSKYESSESREQRMHKSQRNYESPEQLERQIQKANLAKKLSTSTNDSCLTAVRLPLTAVKLLTCTKTMTTCIPTNHDSSEQHTKACKSPNSRKTNRHMNQKNSYNPSQTPYGPHNLPHIVL